MKLKFKHLLWDVCDISEMMFSIFLYNSEAVSRRRPSTASSRRSSGRASPKRATSYEAKEDEVQEKQDLEKNDDSDDSDDSDDFSDMLG